MWPDIYFDTPDLRLWDRRITLRHRSGGGHGTWTLKFPCDGREATLDRSELSWPGGLDTVPEDARRILAGLVRRSPLEATLCMGLVRWARSRRCSIPPQTPVMISIERWLCPGRVGGRELASMADSLPGRSPATAGRQ